MLDEPTIGYIQAVSMPLRRVRELGLRQSIPALVGAVLLVVFVIWWWWPTVRGPLADTDLIVVSDGFLQSAETEMNYRIHEDGFTIGWEPTVTDWCAAADAVGDLGDRYEGVSTVVFSVREPGACAADLADAIQRAVSAAGDIRVVVVAEPGSAIDGSTLSGAEVVNVDRLLGEPGEIERPCLPWDPCQPNGQIAVRDAAGTLTPAGGTRVARMVVTALR